MKKRNGFVSNSSSCSFTIYGTCVNAKDPEIYDDLCDDIKARWVIELENKKKYDDELSLLIKVLEEEFGFYTSLGSDGDCLYFGYSIDNMGEDETKKQFYQRTEAAVKKTFKRPIECCWHEESWYDG